MTADPAPPPDEPSDAYNQAVFDLIVGLRGGLPKKCDFCDQPYVQGTRWPIPEEGGEWTCNECLARWQKERPADYGLSDHGSPHETTV